MERGRLLAKLALLAAVFTAVLGPAQPAAAAGAGDFADNQALVVDLGAAAASVDVQIVNASDAVKVFTLAVVGPAARYLTVDMPSVSVEPGLRSVPLGVKDDAVASQGTLVLTGSDGTLARRPVRLVGAGPGQDPRALVPGSFESLTVPATSRVPSFFRPLPSPLRWGVASVLAVLLAGLAMLVYGKVRDKYAGSSTIAAVVTMALVVTGLVLVSGFASAAIDAAWDGQRVSTVARSVAPPADEPVRGSLTGDNGRAAVVAVDGPQLTVSDLDGAGTYTGTVDTRPTVDGGDVKVVVKVRDWWLYALLAIAVGVLVGWLVGFFYTNRQPAAELDVKVADLRKRVAQLDSDWLRDMYGSGWDRMYLLMAWTETRLDGLDRDDVEAAGKAVTELGALVDRVAAQRTRIADLVRRSASLSQGLRAVWPGVGADRAGWLARLLDPFTLPPESQTAATNAVTALEGTVDAATTATNDAARVAETLVELFGKVAAVPDAKRQELNVKLRAAADALTAAEDAAAVKAVKDNVDGIEQEIKKQLPHAGVGVPQAGAGLLSAAFRHLRAANQPGGPAQHPAAAVEDRDGLQDVAVEVEPKPGEDRLVWRFSDGTASEPFPAPPAGRLTIQHQFAGAETDVGARVVDATTGRTLGSWAGTLPALGTAVRRRTAFAADSRTVEIVAGLLAVGSGLVALYLPNATWGSAGNYVTAVLWGTATAEGIKAVANVIGKRLLS